MMDRNPFDLNFDNAAEEPAPADIPSNPGCDHVDRSAARAETQADTGRHAPNSAGPNRRGMVIHNDLDQGSAEWLQARCGLLTASEMKLILSAKTLKVAANEAVRTHVYELLAQRINNYVEPHFESFDMERGKFDEEHARAKYSETYAPVTECGFITNDKFGFTIGYSPDGLVGDDGLIECKSRVQKWQMRTLVESVAKQEIPDDFVIQVQTGMLVAERKWCDFISYSGGMRMAVVRCYPDAKIQAAIIEAASVFEAQAAAAHQIYNELIASDARLVPTERLIYL